MLGKKWIFSLACIFLLTVPAFADEIVSLKGGYLVLSPEGEFAVDSGGISGTRVDFEDDLGFDDSEEWQGEAALSLGSFRLSGTYLPLRFSGEEILTEAIVFNGQTFGVGSEVESDIDLDYYDVSLAWHVVNFDDLPVRLQIGPELSVKVVDADVSMEEKGSNIKEDDSMLVPVPTIGARSRVALSDYLGLVGRLGYLEYDDNSLLDLDAQIEFSPLPLVGIYAGYRYLNMDVDESEVLIDAKLDGFYGGVMIRF
jgi:outer membrane protein